MRSSFFVLIGLLCASISNGQIKINSPYSSYGIGDLSISEHTNYRGMAHVGVSGGNIYFPSTINPALVQRNLDSDLKYTITDFGAYARWASLTSDAGKQTNGDANFNNVTLIMPLGNRSSIGLGLRPYSTVNYNSSFSEFINSTDEVTYTKAATGAINKLYLSDGFRIINNKPKQTFVSVGAEVAYIFGSIEEVTGSKLSSSSTTSQYNQFTSFSDVAYKGGLSFRKGINAIKTPYRGAYNTKVSNFNGEKDTISLSTFSCEQLIITNKDPNCIPIPSDKIKKYDNHFLYLAEVEIKGNDTIKTYLPIRRDLLGTATRRLIADDSLLYKAKISFDSLSKPTGTFFNFGFVYEHNSTINGKNLLVTERLDANNAQVYADTLSNESGILTLPQILRFGISIDKPQPSGYNKYKIPRPATWSIGLDVAVNQWSKYRKYDGTNNLMNSVRTAVGGEYSPNPKTGKWIERWIYRAGLSYEKLPYEINGTRINEVGITFGSSIPMGSFSTFQRRYPKYLNISIEYGKRGTVANGLVNENYFITTLSLTANSKWFTKRKIGL